MSTSDVSPKRTEEQVISDTRHVLREMSKSLKKSLGECAELGANRMRSSGRDPKYIYIALDLELRNQNVQ